MNKILLTTLATAMLATSGFASGTEEITYGNTIEGAARIKEFQLEYQNTIVKAPLGKIEMRSDEQSTITINAGKTLTLQGGAIEKSTAEGTTGNKVPQIELNGELALKIGSFVVMVDDPDNPGQQIANMIDDPDNPGQQIQETDDKFPTLKDVEITADANASQGAKKLLNMDLLRKLRDGIGGNDIIWQQNPPLNTAESLENYIANVSIAEGVNVKLPFNCSFGQTNNVANFDLSHADQVDYTYVDAEDISAEANPDNIKGSINNVNISALTDPEDNTKLLLAGKVIDEYRAKYGDYAEDSTLGVSLPKKDGKVDFYDPDNNTTGKVRATRIGVSTAFTLPNIATITDNNNALMYNITGKYLNTDAFDKEPAVNNINANSQALTAGQEYNFGFAGTHPVSITLGDNPAEGTKAIFKGDNQYYVPEDTQVVEGNTVVKDGITLSKTTGEPGSEVITYTPVEFAGENSLFPFNQTYGKGTFKAGAYTNTVPAGKIATFTQGFSLGAGHTLIVNGTLIG